MVPTGSTSHMSLKLILMFLESGWAAECDKLLFSPSLPPPPYAMWLLTLASIYHCIYMFRYNIFCFWGILSHCGILVFWSLFSLGQSWTLNSPWATQPPTTYPPPRASDWSMRISQASDWSKGEKFGPRKCLLDRNLDLKYHYRTSCPSWTLLTSVLF